MAQNWWKNFFDEKIGDFMFGRITPRQTSDEVTTILKNSRSRPGVEILDLACGRGRHSLEFARRKFDVTGLDYSKKYVEEATKLSKKQKLTNNCAFKRGDMRNLRVQFPSSSFDLVVSLYNSFGYFSRKGDDQKMLRGIEHVLKPGGLLVLNTLNHDGVENRLCLPSKKAELRSLDRWEQMSNTRFFLDRAKYDMKRRKIRVEWHFLDLKAGHDQSYSFEQNVYAHAELKKMLQDTGLKVIKVWGTLSGEKFTKKSWHQTILAKKI